MPVKHLKDFLENHQVKYALVAHSPAYTAQEIAASAHISGKQLAKTIIVRIGKQLAMVVLPAHGHINFSQLKKATDAANVDLATETEFKARFPDCEVGAMPPFGNLYDIPVYVASDVAAWDQITFNAGSHSELIKMAYRDFERLVKPKIIALH